VIFKSRWLDVLNEIRQGVAQTSEGAERSTPLSPDANATSGTFVSFVSESPKRTSGVAGKPDELTEEQEIELEAYIEQEHPDLNQRSERRYQSINQIWADLFLGGRDQSGSTLGDLRTTVQEWSDLRHKKITLFFTYKPPTDKSRNKPTFSSKRLTDKTDKSTSDSFDSESQGSNSEEPIGDSHQWILSPDGLGKILWCSVSWDRAAVVLREDLMNLPAGSRPVRLFEWTELRPAPRAPPDSSKKPNRRDKVETQSLF